MSAAAETETRTAAAVRPAGWWWDAALLAAFLLVTAALAAGAWLPEVDLAVRGWVEAHRPAPLDTAGRILNRVGQGGVLLAVCGVLSGWLALVTRSLGGLAGILRTVRPPVLVLAAAALVTGTILPLKDVTSRGAPSSPLPPERTVPLVADLPPGEYAASFPAGHVANTIVWYGLGLLLVTALCRAHRCPEPSPRLRRLIRIVPPVIVFTTTVYMSFHWLTDSLAGLTIGLLIDRLVHRLAYRWGFG